MFFEASKITVFRLLSKALILICDILRALRCQIWTLEWKRLRLANSGSACARAAYAPPAILPSSRSTTNTPLPTAPATLKHTQGTTTGKTSASLPSTTKAMQTIPRLASMLLLLFVCPYLPTTLSFLTSPIQRGSVVTSPARSQPSLLRPFFLVGSTSGFRSALFSLSAKSKDPAFRKEILTGSSSYMKVSDSSVSFGATVKLSTALPTSGKAETEAWLRDLDSVAAAIWDPTKVKRLPNAWRLSLISLRFVKIELLPTVDVELLTRDNSAGDAVFYLSR